jgi:hypothetical protein
MDEEGQMNIYDIILIHTMRNGGGTFFPDGEAYSPESGYAVGQFSGTYALVPLDDIPDNFDGAIKSLQLAFPNLFIGTWVHDGYIHIDPVEIVSNRANALAAARKRNQKAIYDFSTGETINV